MDKVDEPNMLSAREVAYQKFGELPIVQQPYVAPPLPQGAYYQNLLSAQQVSADAEGLYKAMKVLFV
jgi:hypothetical protein